MYRLRRGGGGGGGRGVRREVEGFIREMGEAGVGSGEGGKVEVGKEGGVDLGGVPGSVFEVKEESNTAPVAASPLLEVSQPESSCTVLLAPESMITGPTRVGYHILLKHTKSLRPTWGAQPVTRSPFEAHWRLQTIRYSLIQDKEHYADYASQYSECSSGKTQGGKMPPLEAKREYGPSLNILRDVLWALSPGSLSDVVETPLGVHLVYYPPEVESNGKANTPPEK